MLLTIALWPVQLGAAATPAPGPFFEPAQPFVQSQVELIAPAKDPSGGGNFVVRGILLPLASGHCAVFDQELLRIAGIWKTPAGAAPITLATMAQISYADTRRKASNAHPQPTGPLLLATGMHPGAGSDLESLFTDPRPQSTSVSAGVRGALPAALARFEGVELAGATAVLRYRVGTAMVREWLESRLVGDEAHLQRHFEISPHNEPLQFAVGAMAGATWTILNARQASAGAGGTGRVRVATNSTTFTLSAHHGELVATLAPAARPKRVSLVLVFGASTVPDPGGSADAAAGETLFAAATPPPPAVTKDRRWPGAASAPAPMDAVQHNGLVLDQIAVPDDNPWNRRVRVADLAFLSDDRAAVVTYDGDVWLLDGLADAKLERLTWRRFASGLHEPLAITAPRGVIQVATKNGVVRLFDRDGNGEADWFENFNDQLLQSFSTRSFPLDMAIGPDGSTFVTQGGIGRPRLTSGGHSSPQPATILKISADGRTSEVFATGAREAYLTVHPKTGVVTATDQQGPYVPSSVCYLVRPGDEFGFMIDEPDRLARPLAWIPHEQDNSASSQLWMLGAGLGQWDGRLLHLSYGNGQLLLIAPDLDAPIPQGAVIPLEFKTDLPLLHARLHPRGNAVFLAGFQIYDSRVGIPWALGRLRSGATPIVTALAARSCAEGVVLEFAAPLDPDSLRPEKVAARAWNYLRSSAYGSGRYALDGQAGTTPWPVGQTVLSSDRKSVFIHLPNLPPVMQLEVRHDFLLASGAVARGAVYFTIHERRPLDLARAGFPGVDLARSIAVVTPTNEPPATAALGKTLSETIGCAACHSSDGTTEGKNGPTWRNLYGSRRTFLDGASEIADEAYLREKILDPQRKKTKTEQVEMPSYRGVLSETQIEALVLHIKTLRERTRNPKG